MHLQCMFHQDDGSCVNQAQSNHEDFATVLPLIPTTSALRKRRRRRRGTTLVASATMKSILMVSILMGNTVVLGPSPTCDAWSSTAPLKSPLLSTANAPTSIESLLQDGRAAASLPSLSTKSALVMSSLMSRKKDRTIAVTAIPNQYPRHPSMFLDTSKSSSTVVSSSVYRPRVPSSGKLMNGEEILLSHRNVQDRGVLGFDVWQLDAKKSSSIDRRTWKGTQQDHPFAEDDDDDGDDDDFVQLETNNNLEDLGDSPFARLSGLTWGNNHHHPSSGGRITSSSVASAAALTTPRSMLALDIRNSSPLPENRRISLADSSTTLPPSTTLPAWFPNIPTKSQIESLKVTELKEALSQRGLSKTGKKSLLQERLWHWTTEHQEQHQKRMNRDFLESWFQDEDSTAFADFPEERPTTAPSKPVNYNDVSSVPNSLGEWARNVDNVDLKPLLNKRAKIHQRSRQVKRAAKKTPETRKSSSRRDMLQRLNKALQKPSISNVEAKEIYMASKKADQLGDRGVSIQLLKTLLTMTPDDARVHRRLARMYGEQNDLGQARAILKTGLRRMPENPWLWHGLGQLESTHGNNKDTCREYYRKAIEVDPAFAQSYHALGTLEHGQGNIAEAMKVLKEGISYCPMNHRLHHALGDLYRGARLLEDAERCYRRALEVSPRVSQCFAYSALAAVAYEEGYLKETRTWLLESLKVNNGRHAQGWESLAKLEESEGNVEKARLVCAKGILNYERGLIETRQRLHNESGRREGKEIGSPPQPVALSKAAANYPLELKKALLQSVPKYRSGDKFARVYRNWARLEEEHGSFESVDQVYERAVLAFPMDYKFPLQWAKYHAGMKNTNRARILFRDACRVSGSRHGEPFRLYAEMEMAAGNFGQARRILFKGSQLVSQSSDGNLGNSRGLAKLFHTWAICEWHLGDLGRAEVLLDTALRQVETGLSGARLRAFILFSIAQLQYFRSEYHLAQHCVGLCLKEDAMPGGNEAVWHFWGNIARTMDNPVLEKACLDNAKFCLEQPVDETQDILRTGSAALEQMIRRSPWEDKLLETQKTSLSNGNDFFSEVQFPRPRVTRKKGEVIEIK